MRSKRAEITARSEAKKRENGFIKLARWIPSTPESIADYEKQVVRINKKYKAEPIKNLEGNWDE
jgi:hypothetical protein